MVHAMHLLMLMCRQIAIGHRRRVNAEAILHSVRKRIDRVLADGSRGIPSQVYVIWTLHLVPRHSAEWWRSIWKIIPIITVMALQISKRVVEKLLLHIIHSEFVHVVQ